MKNKIERTLPFVLGAIVAMCLGFIVGMWTSSSIDRPVIDYWSHKAISRGAELHVAKERIRNFEDFLHLKPKQMLTPKISSHTSQWSSGNVVLYSGTYGNMVQIPSILDYTMPLRGEDSIFFHNLEDSLNMLRLYRWSHRIVRPRYYDGIDTAKIQNGIRQFFTEHPYYYCKVRSHYDKDGHISYESRSLSIFGTEACSDNLDSLLIF